MEERVDGGVGENMNMTHAMLVSLLLLPSARPQRAYVKGSDYGPCGAVALYCVAKLKGLAVTFVAVSDLVGPPGPDSFHSFEELDEAARALGLRTAALRIGPDRIRSLPTPFIAHMRYSNSVQRMHFVTVLDCSDTGVLILDPPHPATRITWESFSDAFAHHALCFADDDPVAFAFVGDLPSPFEVVSLRWLSFANLLLIFGYAASRLSRRAGGVTSSRGAAHPAAPVRLLLAATAIGGGIVLFRVCGVFQALTAPTLDLNQDVIELGTLSPGEHRAAIGLTNTGAGNLTINSVDATGCQCVPTRFSEVLKPGEEGSIGLTIDVTRGVGHATVTIDSDDPAGSKSVEVFWVGAQKPLLYPAAVVARRATAGQPFQTPIRVRYLGYSGMTFHPAIALTTSPGVNGLRVHVADGPTRVMDSGLPWQAARNAYEITLNVTVDPPEQDGPIDMLAHLEVDYAGVEYRLPLPISVSFH